MTVWVVAEERFQDRFVDGYGEIASNSSEIVGIFSDEKNARNVQEELINKNAHEIIAYDCDPIIVTLEEWEVR